MSNTEVHPDALAQMRTRGGSWAAYQNSCLDSLNLGQVQYLRVGPGSTYVTPPVQYPADTELGTGWRYLYVGIVNLERGVVQELTPTKSNP